MESILLTWENPFDFKNRKDFNVVKRNYFNYFKQTILKDEFRTSKLKLVWAVRHWSDWPRHTIFTGDL